MVSDHRPSGYVTPATAAIRTVWRPSQQPSECSGNNRSNPDNTRQMRKIPRLMRFGAGGRSLVAIRLSYLFNILAHDPQI
jgi:hypothetical protein